MEVIKTTTKQATRIALAMYIGQRCSVCGHVFSSVEDLIEKNPKCSGKNESGIMLACEGCY